MPLHKLSAITTDGAPTMVGKNKGFIALCKKDESFPNFMSYHCTVLSIRKLCVVKYLRWLSKGKVLTRFVNLIEDKKTFINDKNEIYNELTDSFWLVDLGFLADTMEKLNSLNLELQGKDKNIAEMIRSVNSFKAKLALLISDLQIKSLVHFPHMKKMLGNNKLNVLLFIETLQVLQKQFEERFLQFTNIQPIVSFCINPFTLPNKCNGTSHMYCSIADLVQGKAEKLELEILDLKNDILLKSLISEDL
ncbi:hypothetical protein RI129_003668 [Pyrocoelia pectoralis]|uniref:Uncharacterized protein n=1 Tax=Pyrocoelia pectoralis TaxID=417401 RepID=A0AAN7VPY2_9COLE